MITLETSCVIWCKSIWFLPKPLTISPKSKKKTGMEEPWIMAPIEPVIINRWSNLSANEKSLKNGKLCSFFFSASAGGTGLASAVVSDIFLSLRKEKRVRHELAQREDEIIWQWRIDPEQRNNNVLYFFFKKLTIDLWVRELFMSVLFGSDEINGKRMRVWRRCDVCI